MFPTRKENGIKSRCYMTRVLHSKCTMVYSAEDCIGSPHRHFHCSLEEEDEKNGVYDESLSVQRRKAE